MRINCTNASGESTDIRAISTSAIDEDMLISFKDLETLKRIPIGFPNTVVEQCKCFEKAGAVATTTIPLEEEFQDIISNELNPKPMNCAPMKIELIAGATPSKNMYTKRVPLPFEKEAEKVLQDLIDKGVITRVHKPYIWCQGRFRYTRAPMGLNASSDEWCAKSDAMIEGCPWARKIVDDTIIWTEDRQQLERRIRQVLENCRRLNITISKKKFEIGEEIEFAGHIISRNGISRDKSKNDAISKFQTPKNIKELRSFLGLTQQLGAFIPDLAHLTAKIRPLLKKGTAFLWLEEHKEAFIQAKKTLIEKTTVVPFDPSKKTIVLTDASRLYGIADRLFCFSVLVFSGCTPPICMQLQPLLLLS